MNATPSAQQLNYLSYSHITGVLAVEFAGGKRWQFFRVGPDQVTSLVRSLAEVTFAPSFAPRPAKTLHGIDATPSATLLSIRPPKLSPGPDAS